MGSRWAVLGELKLGCAAIWVFGGVKYLVIINGHNWLLVMSAG
jgi:hypothetical protein